LAGRIRRLKLTPFLLSEAADMGDLETQWQRGGLPPIWTASHEDAGSERNKSTSKELRHMLESVASISGLLNLKKLDCIMGQ